MFTSSSAGIPSAGDLAWHAPVDAATLAALPANTYASGPPASLTATANGAVPTIDGVFGWAVGDRLLVKNEAAAAHNGIYAVTDPGSAGTPWVLSRAADADEVAEVPNGAIVFVHFGSANQGLYFVQRFTVANIDTSAESWTELGSFAKIVRNVYVANAAWAYPVRANFVGVNVRCVGGGGGGGGAVATAAGQAACGGGGGGGGYAERWIDAATLAGAGQAVTVGGGGAGNVGANGGAGVASSFAALVVANGGGGGTVSAAVAGPVGAFPGVGGAGATGTILAAGDDGATCSIAPGWASAANPGGGSVLGGQTFAQGANAAGAAGHQYGGGGSGASNTVAFAARAGGAGAGGVVIVDEYYAA